MLGGQTHLLKENKGFYLNHKADSTLFYQKETTKTKWLRKFENKRIGGGWEKEK